MQVNIYLPDELARRVRAAPGLNVSQICQAALRKELEVIEAKERATSDLEEAAVRLRKSHGDWDQRIQDLGRSAGAHWAKSWAEWDELVALEAAADGAPPTREMQRRLDDSVEEYLREYSDDVEIGAWSSSDPFLAAFDEGAVETFREIRRLM